MKTKLSIEVEFDGDQIDVESLASAADTLLQTALSTPGVLDDYGNPQFGEFFIEQATKTRHQFEQQFGIEDRCPKNDGGHEPDWTTTHVECDVEMYVDVTCKHCGQSGCIGSEAKLTEQISW
jgi:hypothetical protein